MCNERRVVEGFRLESCVGVSSEVDSIATQPLILSRAKCKARWMEITLVYPLTYLQGPKFFEEQEK